MPLPAPTATPTVAPAAIRALAAGLALSLSAAAALATPVLIDSPTTVGPLDTMIRSSDGTMVPLAEAEITVQGTTLTMNGRHTIVSLMVGSGATVTHSEQFIFDYSGGAGTDVIYGLDLATTGDVMIDFGGAINLDGRGFENDEGPGRGTVDGSAASGGAHGGESGRSSTGAPSASPYGSVFEPRLFGSGGGTDIMAELGRPGGGALRLTVAGTLINNGVIEADGFNSAPFSEDGGGAGGSIWIDAGAVTGSSGVIRANGGSGDPGTSGARAGAGSGGRIAVYSGGLIPPDLVDLITAYGGDGWAEGITGGDGAAGTVLVSQGGNATLIIDNRDLNGRITPVDAVDAFAQPFDGNVLVRNAGKLGPAPMAALDLHILGDLTVERDGFITADGRGFPGDQGPGAGRQDPSAGSGGAHGGEGGRSSTDASGGQPYGSVFEPTTMGSGGGTDAGASRGQPGGGAIKLVIDGTLRLDGVIEADGFNSASFSADGGGAGGSIWIDAGTLAGITGSIRANGGAGDPGTSGARAGAGSGGRVAVYSGSALPLLFSDRINAYGGDGWASGITGGDGSAGTVYISEAGQATLIIDNRDLDGRITPMSSSDIFAGPFDGDVLVRNRGKIGPAQLEVLTMDVLGDVTIAEDGVITADGRGFPADEGPGAGRLDASHAGGGAHGGQGGISSTGALGGEPYGSVLQPTTFGSGGGTDLGFGGGRPGGGAISLFVGGTLNIEGVIEADGFGRADFSEQGGGAGGSVWIDAPRITGTTGVVRAVGGNGNSGASGAGSGGRVAIYVDEPLPPLFADRVTAASRTGWGSGVLGGNGGAGTVYIEEMGAGRLIIDNDGLDGRITTIGSANPEVDADGRFALDVPVDVRGGGKLGPQRGEFVHFDFGGDVTIGGSGQFTASGMGFASDEGPGAGMAGRFYGGGGGHAGAGSDARSDDPDAMGGGTYGIDTFPTTLGSGGGSDPDEDREGGAGGGAFRLSVAGTLMLDGPVLADGIGGRGEEAGGGAGGSIWIEASAITGVNGVFARGGRGSGSIGGGGGGGYIAIYSCDVSPSVTAVATGGAAPFPGEDGSVRFGSTSVEFVTQPPAEVTLPAGGRLELVAQTAGPATFQWRVDGVELVDDGRISGSGTDTLVITAVTAEDAGRYDVLATDSCGALASDGTQVIVDDSCRADIDGDGVLTIFDFLGFQNLFDVGDLAADFDGDGSLTLFDFLAFQNEFDAGCG